MVSFSKAAWLVEVRRMGGIVVAYRPRLQPDIARNAPRELLKVWEFCVCGNGEHANDPLLTAQSFRSDRTSDFRCATNLYMVGLH